MTASDSASLGDVSHSYRLNRKRLIVLWCTVLVIFGVFGLILQAQQAALSSQQRRNTQNTYRACTVARAAIVKSNAFYSAMTDIEANNPFVDQTIRERRVSLYRGMRMLPTPMCGAAP